jgi:hypothetical protein
VRLKLRKPWATARLDEPAHVIVLLLEQNGGLWYPVVERHENCRGVDPHDGCVVRQRFVGPGAASREDAEAMLRDSEVVTRMRAQA